MARKNLGGDSCLRANRSNKRYNETLEHVYQTAIANLDEKHTKRTSRRRFHIPNFLSLCFKSAADDVVDDDVDDRVRVPKSVTNHNRETAPADSEENEAVFLMKDSGIGHASHYRARGGMSRSTAIFHAMQSMKGNNVGSTVDSYTL
jgi:hypothetical protein